MSTHEVNRSQLYSDLTKFSQTGEYERAVRVANKVLHNFPDDEKAFQYKIISLIHLSRFEDALFAFSKFTTHAENLAFEKAYCQYRSNQTEAALETINSVKNVSLSLRELQAQVYYRLERFEECFEVYRDIIKNTSDDYEEERQTNLAAVIANLSMNGKKVDMPEFSSDSYELAYNIACQLIGRKQYIEAERKLKHAEKLCRESFDDDTLQEEIDEELAIIKIQQAYCIHMQGREKEAQAIYNTILKQKPSDGGLVAIASNNSVTINREQNLFDSKKKIKNASSEAIQHKLTSRQRRAIAINNCLLNIFTSQGDQAIQLCNKLVDKFPEAGVTAILMKSVVLVRENKEEEAKSILKKYCDTHPETKLIIYLTIAQILLGKGDIQAACSVLEDLGKDTYRPGIVSTLVTLHMELEKVEEASKILQKAVTWHQKNKTTTGDLSALWRHAADLHLRGGQPEVAARSLEELLKINPKDSTTLAQLVIAYAQFDPAKAKSLSSQLPAMVDLTPNIDIDLLEASNWMMGLKVIKRAVKGDPSPGTPIVESANGPLKKKKQQKKKRKGKLPVNYDPNVDPDPERWLPKHERSTFRKKKDRRNRDVGKGTQGAATHASDQFDITKIASTQKSGNSTASPVPESGAGGRQQRNKQQKKKRKGGKW